MSLEISFTEHGQCIRGKIVHQSTRALVVEMLSPYAGLADSAHIPTFGFLYQMYPPDGFRDSAYGRKRATGMLLGLLEVGDYLESNRDTLRAPLMATLQQVREVTSRMMSEEKFLQARATLRRKRKEGLVDNRAYQQALGVLRKQRDGWNREKETLLEAFFAENFPMHVCSDSRELLLDSLESGRRLLA